MAYVSGRIPVSEQSWDNVQLAPGYARTAQPYKILPFADTFNMGFDDANVDQRAQGLAQREIYHGDGGRATDLSNMVWTEVERWSSEHGEQDSQEEYSSSSNDDFLRPSTVYVPPRARLIAEDAGSIVDYASSSGSDGDDEMTIRIARISQSTSILRRISAHMPNWHREPKDKSKLNRNLQFPARDGQHQDAIGEPLLGGGDDVPVQQRKRHISLGRLLSKFNDKDDTKMVDEGGAPRESLLRRTVKHTGDVIVWHKQ
jgi:hypothetical protein